MTYRRIRDGNTLIEWSAAENICRSYSVMNSIFPLSEWRPASMKLRWEPTPYQLAELEKLWREQGSITREG